SVAISLIVGWHRFRQLERTPERNRAMRSSALATSIESVARDGNPSQLLVDQRDERRRQLAERRRTLVALFLRAAAVGNDDASAALAEKTPLEVMRAPTTPDHAEAVAAAIQDRFRTDFAPMAEACYQELLARHPQAQGEVIMRYEILADE